MYFPSRLAETVAIQMIPKSASSFAIAPLKRFFIFLLVTMRFSLALAGELIDFVASGNWQPAGNMGNASLLGSHGNYEISVNRQPSIQMNYAMVSNRTERLPSVTPVF